VLEDSQSSWMKFDLEHSEGDLYWSRSYVGHEHCRGNY